MFGAILRQFERILVKNPVSTQVIQQTGTGTSVRRNVLTNAPEHTDYLHSRIKNSTFVSKIKEPAFFDGSREDPNYYTIENIRKEIELIEFIKEQYPSLDDVNKIKLMLYSNLKQFDVILSQEKPDFDSIQSSFKLLYSSVSLNPELSDIFGRFYHFQTKIYERHYFNNRIKFESVPNLNSVSLGYSIELKSGVKSDVVCHPIDYQVNIDTIKFAHEIATLRAASSFLNKKIYHTADKTDVIFSRQKNSKFRQAKSN